jgi:hypothetical protein
MEGLGTGALQVATTAERMSVVVSDNSVSTSKGELLEILVMASVALRFGGRCLGDLLSALHPSLPVPDWCQSHTFPGPEFVVGTMDKLSRVPGQCSSTFFDSPDVYMGRGLLPVNTMGPGEFINPAW